MHTLKAIIFDMDGTLADTEEIHRQAFNAAFDESAIPCHWSQSLYRELLSVSGGRERIRQYLEQHFPRSGLPEPVDRLALTLHRRKSEIYRQKLIDGHVSLRTGIRRLIKEAGENQIALAIATSSSTQNAETLLKVALGDAAPGLFRTIVTCDIVEEKKPSPAVYRYALDRLQLAPEHCIAIEDTHNGNLAALSAGLKTVITTHMFTADDDFSGASLVLNQLGEPGEPPRVLAGSLHGREYADLEVFDQILAGTRRGKKPAMGIPATAK